MKVFIKNNKINYNREGDAFDVDDNFFQQYSEAIDNYNAKVVGNTLTLELDSNTVSDIKDLKIKEAYKAFNEALLPITSNYTDIEIKTFAKKEKEAEKVLGGKKSKFLEALVIEGETVEELANKIVTNAILFETVYGNAEKQLRKTLKEINNT